MKVKIRENPKAGKKYLNRFLPNKIYTVIGIEADDYRIISETGEPYLYPPYIFRVVDRKKPDDWIVTYGDEGERYAYPKALGRVGFFEDYHDGDEKAIRTFWQYVVLAESCKHFEEGPLKKKLKNGTEAYRLSPDNPVVMWNCAHALYRARQNRKALDILKSVLKQKPSTIADHTHWSDAKIADFYNTCRFEIALCYLQLGKLDLATHWLEKHLSNRVSGARSYYGKASVQKLLRRVTTVRRVISNRRTRLWISLLEVKQSKVDRRVKYERGFTSGLVMARTKRQALNKLVVELDTIGFHLISAEDTEEFDLRCLKYEIDKDFKKLADSVRRTGETRFGVFHMYPH